MPRRPQDQIAAPSRIRNIDRRMQAMALRREGKTYAKIGDIMGVTKGQAHNLVTLGLKERRTELAEAADDVKVLELDRLDRMFEMLSKRMANPENESPERTANSIIRIMERRAALLGLDAPRDMRLGGIPGGVPIPSAGGLDTSQMSVAELEELERMYAKYGPKPVERIAEPMAALPAQSGATDELGIRLSPIATEQVASNGANAGSGEVV